MKAIQWKVEGMDCSTCALNIHRYLEKQGMKEIRVNFATGDVQFQNAAEQEIAKLQKEWEDTEYQRLREPEYPPMVDYLDACYWASKGDNTKLDEYYAKCDAVKLK